MKTFVLERQIDVSGVSGTGVVAEGIEFTDGTVALRWVVGDNRSTVVWPDLTAVEAVHGHDGLTRIVPTDTEGGGKLSDQRHDSLREELKRRITALDQRVSRAEASNRRLMRRQ